MPPLDEQLLTQPNDATPFSWYKLFLTDDIVELIATETYRNAEQTIASLVVRRSSRLKSWKPTNAEEIKKFLGLVLFMGLAKFPKTGDYWSKHIIFRNKFNRFQLLLRHIHFEDNAIDDETTKLHKMKITVEQLVKLSNQLKNLQKIWSSMRPWCLIGGDLVSTMRSWKIS